MRIKITEITRSISSQQQISWTDQYGFENMLISGTNDSVFHVLEIANQKYETRTLSKKALLEFVKNLSRAQ